MMRLSGEEADLIFLANTFTDSELKVFKEGDSYFISSQHFEVLEDANAVKDAAAIIAAILNGVCLLALNGTEPVTVGNAIYRNAEGKSHHYSFGEAALIHLRGIPATLTKLLEDEN